MKFHALDFLGGNGVSVSFPAVLRLFAFGVCIVPEMLNFSELLRRKYFLLQQCGDQVFYVSVIYFVQKMVCLRCLMLLSGYESDIFVASADFVRF